MMAIMAAKILIQISRWLGNQGTDFPGRVARRIYPYILSDLGHNINGPTIIVTGTNGKTTTTNMIASILAMHGWHLVHNQAGANMVTGITTAFIQVTNLTGTRKMQCALLETDEANVAGLLSEIKADILLITNFFRDQLDRYGELDRTIHLIQDAVAGTNLTLLLNGDDPLMCRFSQDTGLNCHYYRFADTVYDTFLSTDSREGRYCMLCGREIQYLSFHFAQLGHYQCPACGNTNPEADYIASDLHMDPHISMHINKLAITSAYQGFYNAYNILAAVAMAKLLGIEDRIIQKAIAAYKPQAGRMEQFFVEGKNTTLILVKNPTGFNQSMAALLQDPATKNLFMALNDNAADGRDISWIWDADTEMLTRREAAIQTVVCSGQRSGDMAVRFKYAGFNTDVIQVRTNLEEGIRLAAAGSGQVTHILSTYTALFQCQKILKRLHQAQPAGYETRRILGSS